MTAHVALLDAVGRTLLADGGFMAATGPATRVPLAPDGAAVIIGEPVDAERVRIGATMARVSRLFIDLGAPLRSAPRSTEPSRAPGPALAIDDGISTALAMIGRELDLDRTYVARFSPTRTTFTITHEWLADGIPSALAVARDVSFAPTGPLASVLLAGREIVLRARELTSGSRVHELVRLIGTRSNAIVPLVVGGAVAGFVTFAQVRYDREWSAATLASLRALAEIFAAALDRKRGDDELQARLRFERLLVELSTGLIDAPPEKVDAEVEGALRAIAESQGFQRTLVMMLDEARQRFVLTHEWCAAGIASFRHAMTGLPIQRFGWPLEQLLAGETVSFYRDELPAHAEAARRVMEGDQLATIVTVPMLVAGATVGCIGFHSRDRVPVPADWLARLTLLGQLVAGALARRIAETERQRAFAELGRVKAAIERERDYLREEIRVDWRYDEIIGASAGLRRTLGLVGAVAGTGATVLLRGESGVGKELFARAIHARSARAGGPLVTVNCASIPKDLFESEFFGHVRGAFTGAVKDRVGRFELADGGTLFLDEIGEIPLELQAKLLRVLQEHELERVGEERTRRVDVRVIAATHRDLDADVAARRFRQDLYYRLSVFPIAIPPLRERKDDVIALAEHFLRMRPRDEALVLGDADRQRLLAYDWPGNVRELQHVIERAVILSPRPPLRLDLALPARAPVDRVLTEDELRALERQNLLAALEGARWRVAGAAGAAAALGVHPSTLRDRMRALGLKRPM